jgi:NADH:ubiquinone oxidoreductase subunit 5 (subunit L)/multisubunit Na+/H+ antiporter MnhA subunit
MVTSGIYLLTRVNPIIAESSSWAPELIAWVGAGTALFAATIAVAQNDIKKVLAYSTVSQLGYMFLAVGTGAYVAAIFHMITHAFFKALLFLGSGSVIHGMHHDQDMRNYGGLRALMPITSGTFIVGWLAIAGVPPFSGFWSKDEILAHAYEHNLALWLIGLVTAILTAFYMSRQVFMTFFGRYRYADVRPDEVALVWENRIQHVQVAATEATAAVETAETAVAQAGEKLEAAQAKFVQRETELAEVDPTDEKAVEKATKNLAKAQDGLASAGESIPELEAAVVAARNSAQEATIAVDAVRAEAEAADGSVDGLSDADLPEAVVERREFHPHESPWQMTVPLVVLAVAAIGAGAMNLPFTKDLHFLEHWLEPSLFHNETALSSGGGTLWVLAIVAVVGGALGIAAAVAIYLKGRVDPSRVERPILARGWRYDEAVSDFMGGPGRKGFSLVAWFDATIVDGLVNGSGRLVRSVGAEMRSLQSGLVRSYAALVAVGAVGLIAWFLMRTSL